MAKRVLSLDLLWSGAWNTVLEMPLVDTKILQPRSLARGLTGRASQVSKPPAPIDKDCSTTSVTAYKQSRKVFGSIRTPKAVN